MSTDDLASGISDGQRDGLPSATPLFSPAGDEIAPRTEWKGISIGPVRGVLMETHACIGCAKNCRITIPVSEEPPKECQGELRMNPLQVN